MCRLRRSSTSWVPHPHPESPSLFTSLPLQVRWVRLPFRDCTLCSCSLSLSLHIPRCRLLLLFHLSGIFLCLHGLPFLRNLFSLGLRLHFVMHLHPHCIFIWCCQLDLNFVERI